MSRRAVVEQLAPGAPPCFTDRRGWIEYLVATAEAQSEKGQPAALIFEAGKPVRFNHALDFCIDCDAWFRERMLIEGRCCPRWLLDRAPVDFPKTGVEMSSPLDTTMVDNCR